MFLQLNFHAAIYRLCFLSKNLMFKDIKYAKIPSINIFPSVPCVARGTCGAGLHRSALGSHSWPLHIYSDWPWVMAPADAHCAVINPESLLGLKCMWSLFCGSGLIFLSHFDHRNGEMYRCAPGFSSWLLQCETLASHQMLHLVSRTCKNINVLLSFMLTRH